MIGIYEVVNIIPSRSRNTIILMRELTYARVCCMCARVSLDLALSKFNFPLFVERARARENKSEIKGENKIDNGKNINNRKFKNAFDGENEFLDRVVRFFSTGEVRRGSPKFFAAVIKARSILTESRGHNKT